MALPELSAPVDLCDASGRAARTDPDTAARAVGCDASGGARKRHASGVRGVERVDERWHRSAVSRRRDSGWAEEVRNCW